MTDVRDAVRELDAYMAEYPAERNPLLPLYDALQDHSRAGVCTHHDRCPVVKAGALVLDEQDRALGVWTGDSWAFPEGPPAPEDESLSFTGIRALMTETGCFDVQDELPGLRRPFLMDVSWAGPEDAPAIMRYGFRYLFRARSSAIASPVGQGRARWVPVEEIRTEHLKDRLRSHLLISAC